jgi:soluble lytic murein transglycosylase-like protein
MNTSLALLFIAASQTVGLPPGLLSALCFVESSHRTNVVHHDDGNGDSLGICQIKLSTARQMGYTGTAKTLLTDPRINILYSSLYLASRIHRYRGDVLMGIAAYNAGSFKINRLGQPVNRRYIIKVLDAWREHK